MIAPLLVVFCIGQAVTACQQPVRPGSPTLRVDCRHPHQTLQSFCGAFKAEDFEALKLCCVTPDPEWSCLRDATLHAMMAEFHFARVVLARFGADAGTFLKQGDRFAEEMLGRCIKEAGEAEVQFVKGRAVLASKPGWPFYPTWYFNEEGGAWKIDFLQQAGLRPESTPEQKKPDLQKASSFMQEMANSIDALSAAIKAGQFKTVAEVKLALAGTFKALGTKLRAQAAASTPPAGQ